jgi:hypothetical protein
VEVVAKNKVTLVPQELDLLAVVWETAEVDSLTQWWCFVQQVARMLQTQPADHNNINYHMIQKYTSNFHKIIS